MRTQTLLTVVMLGSALIAQEPSRRIQVSPPSAQPVRRALLIGNRSYRVTPLLNPTNDAKDLGSALKGLGFHTTVLSDLTKPAMEKAVDEFASAIRPGDLAIFFYAGHGFQIDADNYLVPVEFTARTADQARTQSVPFAAVKAKIEKSPSAGNILILDSCRDNPFTNNSGYQKGLALMEAGLGSYLVFSASPGRTASDNQRSANGLFTAHLLRTIAQPLTVAELFRKVRQEVYEQSDHRQLPYLHDQLIRDLRLVASTSPAPAAPPAPGPSPQGDLLDRGRQAYQNGRCDQAAELLDRVVRIDPANPFAQNAAGLAQACLNFFVPALERFSMAVQLKPDFATAYLNRGSVRLKAAQYELAVQDFTWAVEQDPEAAMPYSRRGRALFGLRRYEDALNDFEKAIELDPSDAAPFFGRGQIRFQFGRYREALQDFDAALARNSEASAIYRERARCRERLGDKAGAAADREAAERHPGRGFEF